MKEMGNSVDQKLMIKENSKEGMEVEGGGERRRELTELKSEVDEHSKVW